MKALFVNIIDIFRCTKDQERKKHSQETIKRKEIKLQLLKHKIVLRIKTKKIQQNTHFNNDFKH